MTAFQSSRAPVCTAAPALNVAVAHPWFRLITPNVPAGGYMTLRSKLGQPVTLTGMRSPACGRLTLHRTEGDRIVPIPDATIPLGGALTLVPGGNHLMCMSPHMVVDSPAQVTLMLLMFKGDEIKRR